ncbi:unnamed protein product, partial [Ectocarpus sp. 8 AP-2014]
MTWRRPWVPSSRRSSRTLKGDGGYHAPRRSVVPCGGTGLSRRLSRTPKGKRGYPYPGKRLFPMLRYGHQGDRSSWTHQIWVGTHTALLGDASSHVTGRESMNREAGGEGCPHNLHCNG